MYRFDVKLYTAHVMTLQQMMPERKAGCHGCNRRQGPSPLARKLAMPKKAMVADALKWPALLPNLLESPNCTILHREYKALQQIVGRRDAWSRKVDRDLDTHLTILQELCVFHILTEDCQLAQSVRDVVAS